MFPSAIAFYIAPLSFLLCSRFPFLSLSSRQTSPPRECDRSHSLLCCIAFARGHRKTAENLCRYSRPFNRVCHHQSTVSEKITSRSAFRYAGRGPTVTHPSTNQGLTSITGRTLSVWNFYIKIVLKFHKATKSQKVIFFTKNCIYF